jgi:hypothetical protein
MQPAGHVISCEEFWTAFRAHHIPEGLMECKLNEFLALTQGTRTVLQRLSIIYANMQVITLTMMPRSRIVSVVASVPSARNA